jgi:putative DNA primase/helicase
MGDYLTKFRQAIEAGGLTPPDEIIDDGKLHRFSTNRKRGDDSGWYVLHCDGIPAGTFGCWRSGLQSTWCAKSDNELTGTERQAMRERIESMKRQREAEEFRLNDEAADKAAAMWQAAPPADEKHGYIRRKGIKPHGTKINPEGWLLVPMRDTSGKLWNVERIAPEKPQTGTDKKGLYGGRRKALYFGIGKPEGILIVCEGFATGASIHECTGHAVAVAFNAGNLEPVALALRAKYPAMLIVIAADDDHATAGNPGMTKATAAARAVGGVVAVPNFGRAA